MSGPVVEARHQRAVDALCVLTNDLAQVIDLATASKAHAFFAQGVLAAIGFLALDPTSGSRTNTKALTDHGAAVVDAWLERHEASS